MAPVVHPSRPHASRLPYNSITMSRIAVDIAACMVRRTSRSSTRLETPLTHVLGDRGVSAPEKPYEATKTCEDCLDGASESVVDRERSCRVW